MELTHRLCAADGEELARVTLAERFRDRLIGLMGSRPAPDTGLLFRGTNSIHMLFMRTPIDVFFLERPDGEGLQRVRAIRLGLRPWIGLALSLGAADTLELAPHSHAGERLAVGDRVRVEVAPER
jgi:uncharacterized membrane protein (UPF0127 family)